MYFVSQFFSVADSPLLNFTRTYCEVLPPSTVFHLVAKEKLTCLLHLYPSRAVNMYYRHSVITWTTATSFILTQSHISYPCLQVPLDQTMCHKWSRPPSSWEKHMRPLPYAVLLVSTDPSQDPSDCWILRTYSKPFTKDALHGEERKREEWDTGWAEMFLFSLYLITAVIRKLLREVLEGLHYSRGTLHIGIVHHDVSWMTVVCIYRKVRSRQPCFCVGMMSAILELLTKHFRWIQKLKDGSSSQCLIGGVPSIGILHV